MRPSANRAPDKREIAFAEQLIGALEDRFDAGEFRDEYQEQLKGLLAAKARARSCVSRRRRSATSADSLIASLQASLKTSRKEAGHGRRA